MFFRLLILIFLTSQAYADTVTLPTTYSNGSTVTASNLNGNFTAITAQVNGGLDNNNANTTGGYRFFEIKSSLPTNGSQGRVVYNTSDNSLNFDNGASWQSAVAPSGTLATGKIPYYNSGWSLLTPGAQYLPLVSNGATSLPSYQPLNLANGVTSTLAIANGGTGQTTAQAAIDALLPSQASANGKYFTSNGSASSWGSFSSLSTLNTTGNVGIGTTSLGYRLQVSGNVNISEGVLISKQATAPAINSCGTNSPAVTSVSTDMIGEVTLGNSGVTASCVIDYNATKTSSPYCFCQLMTNGDAVTCTATTTQLTISELAGGNFAANARIRWFCPVPNG